MTKIVCLRVIYYSCLHLQTHLLSRKNTSENYGWLSVANTYEQRISGHDFVSHVFWLFVVSLATGVVSWQCKDMFLIPSGMQSKFLWREINEKLNRHQVMTREYRNWIWACAVCTFCFSHQFFPCILPKSAGKWLLTLPQITKHCK